MCQDIGKEVEDHAPVKARLLSAANAGSVILRGRVEKVTSDWLRLTTALCDSESHIHAARIPLMSSHQLVNELTMWLQSVEKTVAEGVSMSLELSVDVQREQLKYQVHIFNTIYLLVFCLHLLVCTVVEC